MYFTIVMLQKYSIFFKQHFFFLKNTIFSANFRYFMYFCADK